MSVVIQSNCSMKAFLANVLIKKQINNFKPRGVFDYG